MIQILCRRRKNNPLLVGDPGVGKSTLGADAPSPIFLGAEDGTAHLDVARLPQPEMWADVLAAVALLAREPHEFKTLVIDSLDWIEPLVHAFVCAEAKVKSMEDVSYGKLYIAAVEQWRLLISALDRAEHLFVNAIGRSHIHRVDDDAPVPETRSLQALLRLDADFGKLAACPFVFTTEEWIRLTRALEIYECLEPKLWDDAAVSLLAFMRETLPVFDPELAYRVAPYDMCATYAS